MPIERLAPRHAAAYRALMLRAYADHPDAFTATPEERGALPLAWWESRLDAAPDAHECVFGALDGGRLLGVAGLAFEKRPKTCHKASLFGMYVVPEARGGGTGLALVRAVLDGARARPGVRVVQLTVTDGNAGARALYERCGFVAFGTEPMAVCMEGRYLAKVHMWTDLGSADAAR